MEIALKAVKLASKLCAEVQKTLSITDEKQDKQDDSPVTIADYGAQSVVAWVLQRELGPPVMVAEESSEALTSPDGRAMLERITALVNSIIVEEDPTAKLSPDDIVRLIDLGGSEGGKTGKHWVLDPIDGTRGFVGMRQYSVCLGLIDEGSVALGVLGCPNLPTGVIEDNAGGGGAMERAGEEGVGQIFAAIKGHGTYCGSLSASPSVPMTKVEVEDVSRLSLHPLLR